METIKFLIHEIERATTSRVTFDLLCQRLATYCLQELQQINRRADTEKTTINKLLKKIARDVLQEKEKEEVLPYVKCGLISSLLSHYKKQLAEEGNLNPCKISIKIDWWFYGRKNFE